MLNLQILFPHSSFLPTVYGEEQNFWILWDFSGLLKRSNTPPWLLNPLAPFQTAHARGGRLCGPGLRVACLAEPVGLVFRGHGPHPQHWRASRRWLSKKGNRKEYVDKASCLSNTKKMHTCYGWQVSGVTCEGQHSPHSARTFIPLTTGIDPIDFRWGLTFSMQWFAK